MSLDFIDLIPDNKVDSLLILLHGYGADKHDLIDIGKHIGYGLRSTAVVSPDAIFDCDIGFGRQWFPINNMDKSEILDGLEIAKPYIDDFIDSQMIRFNLKADRVALLGFSQGCMLALHVGLRRKNQLAGIIGFSGLLAGSDILENEIVTRPPITLIHGDKDKVVDSKFMNLATQSLIKNNCQVDTLLCTGLEHGIDNQGIITASLFLQKVFT